MQRRGGLPIQMSVGYIELRTAWQQLADRTKCSDTDRELLLGLSLELARLRLQEVAAQHGVAQSMNQSEETQ